MQKPNPTKPSPILIGKVQKLLLARLSPHGAYLVARHTQNTLAQNALANNQPPLYEVLLPNKFLPPQSKLGEELEVFVYTDSQDRPIATTQTPKAQCGDIAVLEVVGHSAFGCFLDLGIDKDIFMPSKTPTNYRLRQKLAVRLMLDKQGRLMAKRNIKSTLRPAKAFAMHSKLRVFVFEQTPLGYGCVVENNYYGLLFKHQVPQGADIHIGTYINAYVQSHSHNHHNDGLNLTLFAPMHSQHKQSLLESMPLSLDFSSSPTAIFEQFHISKKLFKRLLNELVREKKIAFIKELGIFRRLEHSTHHKEQV